MRKTLYTEKVVVPLTKWQREQLEKEAAKRNVSFAKLTRAALGQLFEQEAATEQ